MLFAALWMFSMSVSVLFNSKVLRVGSSYLWKTEQIWIIHPFLLFLYIFFRHSLPFLFSHIIPLSLSLNRYSSFDLNIANDDITNLVFENAVKFSVELYWKWKFCRGNFKVLSVSEIYHRMGWFLCFHFSYILFWVPPNNAF